MSGPSISATVNESKVHCPDGEFLSQQGTPISEGNKAKLCKELWDVHKKLRDGEHGVHATFWLKKKTMIRDISNAFNEAFDYSFKRVTVHFLYRQLCFTVIITIENGIFSSITEVMGYDE